MGQNLPVHKNSAARGQALLYEGIGVFEVLEEIFIFDIIDLDEHPLVAGEEILIQIHAQDREDVCDVGLLE
jgi:hypothetical protein